MKNTEKILKLLAPYISAGDTSAIETFAELVHASVDSMPDGADRDRRAKNLVARVESKLLWNVLTGEAAIHDSKIIAAVILGSNVATPDWLTRICGIFEANEKYSLITPLLGILQAINSGGVVRPEVKTLWLSKALNSILSENRNQEVPSEVAGELTNQVAEYVGFITNPQSGLSGKGRLDELIELIEKANELFLPDRFWAQSSLVQREFIYKALKIIPEQFHCGMVIDGLKSLRNPGNES